MNNEEEVKLIDKMALASFRALAPQFLAEFSQLIQLGMTSDTTLESALKVIWGTAYVSARYGMEMRQAFLTTPAPAEKKEEKKPVREYPEPTRYYNDSDVGV